VKVEFLPDAEQELLEAAEYYEARKPDLGNEFLSEVERLLATLSDVPVVGEKLDRIHRRIPLRRFPYALIFRCEADLIRFIAIAHRRRRPRYWKPRVQEPSLQWEVAPSSVRAA